ncbi:NfuA family Fe-S biogenesis protein [Buchnera aphidicola]|uniref:NfuA family Fe-S biogenesis protein n=1 Tax=Buchnera aphidicola TaxID=9 RepID=UPI0034640F71
MITVSLNAQNHFLSLLSTEPIGTHIRAFITNPGTSYAECGVAYCLQHEVELSDIKLKYKNFYIYVDRSLSPYFKNAEIDLITDKLGSQLTFKAPYAKTNNLKKYSVLEKKVENFLQKEINPYLLSHRGRVELLKIDQDNIVFIRFYGGCNGCSMSKITLKEMIEKKLMLNFPELKKIVDSTEHFHGNHSFY